MSFENFNEILVFICVCCTRGAITPYDEYIINNSMPDFG